MDRNQEIKYIATGADGFALFLEGPIAGYFFLRISNFKRFAFIEEMAKSTTRASLLPFFSALYGWGSAFNRHFFRKMATLIVEGPPCVGKSYRK